MPDPHSPFYFELVNRLLLSSRMCVLYKGWLMSSLFNSVFSILGWCFFFFNCTCIGGLIQVLTCSHWKKKILSMGSYFCNRFLPGLSIFFCFLFFFCFILDVDLPLSCSKLFGTWSTSRRKRGAVYWYCYQMEASYWHFLITSHDVPIPVCFSDLFWWLFRVYPKSYCDSHTYAIRITVNSSPM